MSVLYRAEASGAGGVPNAAAALGCLMGPREAKAHAGGQGPPDQTWKR
jgi:hypothetical protein